MKKIIPNVIVMFELLNGDSENKLKYGPKLLQKLESHVMINMTCDKIKNNINLDNNIITIHDSFICYDVDIKKVESCLLESLYELNVPFPTYTIDLLSMENISEHFSEVNK